MSSESERGGTSHEGVGGHEAGLAGREYPVRSTAAVHRPHGVGGAALPRGGGSGNREPGRSDKSKLVRSSVIAEAYAEMRVRRFFVYPLIARLTARRSVCVELTDLLTRAKNAAAESDWEQVHEAWLRLIVFPFLVLSGVDSGASFGSANASIFRRIHVWRSGGFAQLLDEAKLKFQLKDAGRKGGSKPGRNGDELKRVGQAMREGKVHTANKMLSGWAECKGGVLPCSDDVIAELKKLHPDPRDTRDPMPIVPPAESRKKVSAATMGLFESLVDGSTVRRRVVHLRGAHGPSGLDAEMLKGLCRGCGIDSNKLCDAVAGWIVALGSYNIPGWALEPFLAARLIPLDKGGGKVRPIGVGEIWRRLCGKIAVQRLRLRIQTVCGNRQLGAGFPGGCEAAVHAAQEMFDDDTVEVMVLVDAENAFNRVNRAGALDTIEEMDEHLGPLFRNFYPASTPLWLPDGSVVYSREGSTQGCPLGMPMFSMATVKLIRRTDGLGAKQQWYADDADGLGKTADAIKWLRAVRDEGRGIGYRVKESKTVVLAKPEFVDSAKRELKKQGLDGVQVVDVSCVSEKDVEELLLPKYLGVPVGPEAFREAYMEQKVKGWVKELELLGEVAGENPHEAYALLVKGQQAKWRYLLRNLRGEFMGRVLRPLDEALRKATDKILGWAMDDLEYRQAKLPGRCGGLGLMDMEREVRLAYEDSHVSFEDMRKALIEQKDQPLIPPKVVWAKQRGRARERRNEEEKEMKAVMEEVGPLCRVAMEDCRDMGKRLAPWQHKKKKEWLAKRKEREELEKGMGATKADASDVEPEAGGEESYDPGTGNSAWLSAVPREDVGLRLDPRTFRMAMNMRCGRQPEWMMQKVCPNGACKEAHSLEHSFHCKSSAHEKHDVARDCSFNLAGESFPIGSVVKEPHFNEVPRGMVFRCKTTKTESGCRGDLAVRDLWGDGKWGYCDMVFFDPNAKSYAGMSAKRKYEAVAQRKIRENRERVERVDGGSFSPLVCSAFGGLGVEMKSFIRRCVEMRSCGRHGRKKQDFGREIFVEKAKFQMAILRKIGDCFCLRPKGEVWKRGGFGGGGGGGSGGGGGAGGGGGSGSGGGGGGFGVGGPGGGVGDGGGGGPGGMCYGGDANFVPYEPRLDPDVVVDCFF
jgi:hypothetical protein